MVTASTIVAMLIGFVLPALAALVTKETLPKPAKVLILLFLSTATGVLTSVLGSLPTTGDGWWHLFLNILMAFAVAASSDQGVWEKSGATARIHNSTDRFLGIGPAVKKAA
jgi:hypothetical protein